MFIYPWGDLHSLNLGWFLIQFKAWTEKIEEYLDNGGGTAENLANVIAPVFNAANTYAAGDYVLYNNELYKANQAVNPGTWNPDAWDNCLIVDEMGSGGGSAGVDNVARLMIAGQYSASFAYQKYGICRYNDKLWMCNTDLPTGGEAWNPAHWDEITVGAGLTGLRRSVETLSTGITELQNSLNNILPLDTAPTSGSTKGITSEAVYNASATQVGTAINPIVDASTIEIRKSGRVISAGISNTVNVSGTGTWIAYFTLPEGFRPVNIVRFIARDLKSGNLYNGRVQTGGVVELNIPAGTTAAAFFSLSYII